MQLFRVVSTSGYTHYVVGTSFASAIICWRAIPDSTLRPYILLRAVPNKAILLCKISFAAFFCCMDDVLVFNVWFSVRFDLLHEGVA